MKEKIAAFITFLFFITTTLVTAQDTAAIQVIFKLTAAFLPVDSAVYITGSLDQLGQWNPGIIKMDYAGNHTWSKKIKLTAPAVIAYKYTLGSWEREGADTQGKSLPNFNAAIAHDTIINDSVQVWTNPALRQTVQSHITGTVDYHKNMQGAGVAGRTVAVWLPPGYSPKAHTRYAVVYMQDGQNLFDAATSSFGTEWRVDETCDSLMNIKAIPPVIVVGIYNTADRSDEYAPGEKGTAYMQFVVNNLKPFIDSAYRTVKDATHTIAGGASSGGLISFMLAWQYPGIFSKAICMSPALKVSHLDYVKEVNAYSGKKKKVFFYLDNGGIGLESQLRPGVDAMIATLAAKGYKKGKDFEFVQDSRASHSEAAWAMRFPKALLLCFGKK